MKRHNKHRSNKQEITLMTLLANEATKGAGEILSKHNIAKPKNHNELEVKLAELYFAPKTDKLAIEKQLANIHPHKDWLIRSLNLNTSEDIDKLKKELSKEVKIEPIIESKDSCYQTKCKDDSCIIHGTDKKMSNFFGPEEKSAPVTTEGNKQTNSMELMSMIGCIGLIGLTFIIVSKNLK